MKRKWLAVLAVIGTCCGATLMAQEGQPPAGGPGRGGPSGGPHGPMINLSVEQLKTDLKLTDDQVKKLQPLVDQVKTLFDTWRKEMMAMRGEHRGAPDMTAMRAKMEELKKQIADAIVPAKAFLTAEQFQQLSDKVKLPERPRFGAARITAESLKAELKLTDDQVKKLQPLLDKVDAARQAQNKEIASLRMQNDGMLDVEVLKAKREELRQQIAGILAPAKTFLTAEQLTAVLEKLNKARRGGPGGNRGGHAVPAGN